MSLTVVQAPDLPAPARVLHEALSKIAPVEASSTTVMEGKPVAYAVAAKLDDHAIAIATSVGEPKVRVVLKLAGTPEEAMIVVRSLVHRSPKRLVADGLVPADFADLEEVPLELCSPQYVVDTSETFGLELPGLVSVVGCNWAEMADDPEARPALVAARCKTGITNDALSPLDGTIAGISRAIRKAKAPILDDAAWALEALVEDHPEEVRACLQELVLLEGLTEDRLEIVGALVDATNEALVEHVDSLPADGSPRVVLCQLRLDSIAPAGQGRVVVVYFYPALHADKTKLERRHPERPLGDLAAKRGFAEVDAVLEKHRGTVLEALAAREGLKLQRGFHADVSLQDARASFVEDGFVPVLLVLDP